MASKVLPSATDLSSLDKAEASKTLFAQIQWEELLRSGVVLQHRDHQLLEKAQGNLSVVLDNATDANEFAKMLLKIAENCTTNLPVQQYVFTRIEEVLGLAVDASDKDRDAFGLKHAPLFTTDGRKLADNAFVRAINFSDLYLQRSASVAFAALLTVTEGNTGALVQWINAKLSSPTTGVWDMALPALCVLARGQNARPLLLKAGIVQSVVSALTRVGVNGNPQHIYELLFVLWTLSLGETDLPAYLSSGAIPKVIELFSVSPSRKVTRMIIAVLRNLAQTENADVITEMLTSGIMRVLESIEGSNGLKQMADVDVDADFRVLSDMIHKNHRELTSFDKYASEVKSGNLRWGAVHTEKFWRENVRHMELDNFALLKSLLTSINSTDSTTVCIALYDIGEFCRFYPNGRVVVSRLGGKDAIMKLLNHSDAEVQQHTLQCISKVMVNNWEHLR